MLPDKTTMCHRTGFAKSCFECVTQHGCRLWKHVQLEGDPRLPVGAAQSAVDHWDCIDSLIDLYQRDMLRRQVQTTATVDKLSKEVREANDHGMANALLGINREIRRQNDMLTANPDQLALPIMSNGVEPKLIEG